MLAICARSNLLLLPKKFYLCTTTVKIAFEKLIAIYYDPFPSENNILIVLWASTSLLKLNSSSWHVFDVTLKLNVKCES